MSSRNKIYECLDENSRGDVEKYFHHLCTMIEENSGTHEFTITSADCYNNNAPFKENQFTRFNLTNSMDIIDISKGFITMRVNVDVQFLYDNWKFQNLVFHQLAKMDLSKDMITIWQKIAGEYRYLGKV